MESVSLDLETRGPGANWEGTVEHENLTIKSLGLSFASFCCEAKKTKNVSCSDESRFLL